MRPLTEFLLTWLAAFVLALPLGAPPAPPPPPGVRESVGPPAKPKETATC